MSLREENDDDLRSNEVKVHEAEKSFEGLISKELPKHLKKAFLGEEKSKTMIIALDLIIEKERSCNDSLKA